MNNLEDVLRQSFSTFSTQIQEVAALVIFKELWPLATDAQRQKLTDALCSGLTYQLERHPGNYHQELTKIIASLTPSTSLEFHQKVSEALLTFVITALQNDSQHYGVQDAVIPHVRQIISRAADKVMAEQLPDVEKAVRKLLADGIVDAAVQKHADDMLAKLRQGLD